MNAIDQVEALGLIAGTLTTLAFIPQVVQVWRTRRVDDINLATFLIFCTGIFLWMGYGLAVGRLAILLPNIVTFVLAMAILIGKLRFGRRRPSPPDE